MYNNLLKLASIYDKKVAQVCSGKLLQPGESCKDKNPALAKNVARKYKTTLPIFKLFNMFKTSAVSRIINAVLDDEVVAPEDIDKSKGLIMGHPDYKGINLTEWEEMLTNYGAI